MEYIIKENGNVYLVKEHDVEGRHKTISYMGKEFVEIDEPKEINKPKRKKKEQE